MTMGKVWTCAAASFGLSVICWVVFSMSGFEMIRVMTTVYSGILCVGLLFTGGAGMIRKSASPYCVFAAVNVILAIGIAAYSVYDIKTDTDEWFGGLVGVLLLAFVIPFIAVLLVADIIVWKKSRAKAIA